MLERERRSRIECRSRWGAGTHVGRFKDTAGGAGTLVPPHPPPNYFTKKGVGTRDCMQLWQARFVHQRVPRRSSSANRMPHTGSRQVHTCERVPYLPTPCQRIAEG